MKNVFIVDYAYGFNADTCQVDYVCKLRCLAALRAFKKYSNASIVLGAGMKEVTGDCGPLADIMEKFLLEQGVPKSSILRNPHGHNTLTETEAAYAIIKKHGMGKIVCATSTFHAPRVWLIWFLRFGISPTVYISRLRAPRGQSLKEILKIPRDITQSIRHRF